MIQADIDAREEAIRDAEIEDNLTPGRRAGGRLIPISREGFSLTAKRKSLARAIPKKKGGEATETNRQSRM